MTIIEEIRLHFATFTDGLRKLDSVPSEYPAYTIRYNGEYGVVIDYDYEKDICEESTNAMISTRKISLAGGQKKCLLLTCYDEEYRNEFALLCETFVTPGEGGALREILLRDPLAWWDRWIGLLGNRKTKKRCYDIIAEMVVLYKLFSLDKTCNWAAQERGSHDIESETASYEVKSTIKKSDLCVTISSQHQLFSEKDLFLAFVRLEKSYEGISINDMEKKLIEIGYDNDIIAKQLFDSGFVKGSRARDEKYKVLEIRKYTVNDVFPKITKDSFTDGKFPESITKLIYTIDLANLSYETFD